MPVDRLSHIRHNWQEKGNGPRGRDVDFLLGLVDEPSDSFYHSAAGEAEQEAERYREALEEIVRREARSEYSSIYAAPGQFAEVARTALALPATESAQPEEDSSSRTPIEQRPGWRSAPKQAQPEDERRG